MEKENKEGPAKLAFLLSIIALILAGSVSIFDINLWLAGTQWILISILLATWATYLNSCKCECYKKE